jgi:hypothetical protein
MTELDVRPLDNAMTTAIRGADLLRFLRSTGREPTLVDLDPRPLIR